MWTIASHAMVKKYLAFNSLLTKNYHEQSIMHCLYTGYLLVSTVSDITF